MRVPSVKLIEWDGDRSGWGGFCIEVHISGIELIALKSPLSYHSNRDRSRQLYQMRKKARKIANHLGVKVKENLR